MKRKIVSLGILLTALALTGCAKKNKVTESTTEVVASQTAAITVAEEEAETSASNKIMVAEAYRIYKVFLILTHCFRVQVYAIPFP